MHFSDQSDEPNPCIDCGKEIGLDCACTGPCRQCAEPVAMWLCGIRFCRAHADAFMKSNMKRRGLILAKLGWKKAA